MEPHARAAPVLRQGEPRRPLSPPQRTRMRARRPRPSRALLLTTRRRPAALEALALGPGELRRPLLTSRRTLLRARCSRLSRAPLSTPAVVPPPWRRLSSGRASRADRRRRLAARRCGPAAPGWAGPRCLLRPSSRRSGGACPMAGRAAPTAVAASPHVVAGPLLRAGPGPLPTPAVVPPPWRSLSAGRACRADHCRRLTARCCGPAAPGGAGPRCLLRPSSRRSGGAAPRTGRAAPTAVNVSPPVVAGPPLQAEPGSAVYSGRRPAALEAPVLGPGEPRRPLSTSRRTLLRARCTGPSWSPLSTSAVVPPPRRRLSAGRASRADHCRRLAARCCGPAAPGGAGPRCLLRPSSRRSGGANPRTGRAAPTAVNVSPLVVAGPPLRAEPGPAVYSGRRPRCCGPAAPD